MRTRKIIVIMLAIMVVIGLMSPTALACNTSFQVTYNGNGNTSGSAPSDGNSYFYGGWVNVLGNSGGLARTGYVFDGWNTKANGTGMSFAPGGHFLIYWDTTLYAKWKLAYHVTYNGNSNTSGSVPVDNSDYASGSSVTVLGNTGDLAKAGFSFDGWNTKADGTGTAYGAGDHFQMACGDKTLYAQWKPAKFVINTSVTNGSIDPDQTGIAYGSDLTINYGPETGFHLVSVKVDGAGVDIGTYPTSYTFHNVTDNHTIAVVYSADTHQEDTYTISTSVTGGTITADITGINAGESKTVSYSPDPGNFLVSVMVDSIPQDIATCPDSYTFTDINDNHTISVAYRGNVVTDTDSNLLYIVGSILLLSGGALVAVSRLRRKVKE
jgi:uncharacterized repeat protein (TIGR02543 family)